MNDLIQRIAGLVIIFISFMTLYFLVRVTVSPEWANSLGPTEAMLSASIAVYCLNLYGKHFRQERGVTVDRAGKMYVVGMVFLTIVSIPVSVVIHNLEYPPPDPQAAKAKQEIREMEQVWKQKDATGATLQDRFKQFKEIREGRTNNATRPGTP